MFTAVRKAQTWKGFPGGASDREPACQCRRRKRLRFDPWVRNIPRRRAWQATPVFLSGEEPGRLQSIVSHGVEHDRSTLAQDMGAISVSIEAEWIKKT